MDQVEVEHAIAWRKEQIAALEAWTRERMLADPQAGIRAAEEIRAVAAERGDQMVEAEARILLGKLYYELDLMDEAIRHLREAETLFDNEGNHSGGLNARRGIGSALIWRGRTDEADAILRTGLEEARAVGEQRLICEFLSSLAALTATTGRLYESIDFHAEEMAIEEHEGLDYLWLKAANNLALCFMGLHDFEGAKRVCRDALEMLQDNAEHRILESGFLHNLAFAEESMGEVDEALGHYVASIDASAAMNDVRSECLGLIESGRLARTLGHTDMALDHFRRAVERQGAEPGAGESEIIVLGQWGVEATTGAWTRETAAELERLLEAGLPVDRDSRVFLYDALAESYEGLHDHEAANRTYRRSIRFREDLWRETLQLHAYSSAQALQTRDAQRKADEERVRREELDRMYRQVVSLNADNEALISQLQSQAQLLGQLSRQDSLTGLVNRRGFDERHAEDMIRSEAFGLPLTVGMADIDDFKEINDQRSHAVGDGVLRRVARIISEALRETDVVARYGGDEFALLLPGCDQQTAAAIAERIRRAVEAYPWEELDAGLAVRLCIGMWTTGMNAQAEDGLPKADQLLYRAKRDGKNRVVAGGGERQGPDLDER